MTDLRNAKLTDLLPKSVADQQWVKSISDAWHELAILILDLPTMRKSTRALTMHRMNCWTFWQFNSVRRATGRTTTSKQNGGL